MTVKYNRRRRRSKEDWIDGAHYVKRLVRLINVCTTSTISMFAQHSRLHYHIIKVDNLRDGDCECCETVVGNR